MTWRSPLALLAIPLLGLALTVGCDDADELRAIDLAELPERFACDDVTVVAASVDGSEALLLGVEDGLAAAALELGEIVEAEYALPDERLTVRWVSGSNVYAGHCGRDSGETWKLDQRSDAVSGRVAIRIAPNSDGSLSVSASLVDLLLAPSRAGAGPMFELSATSFEGLPLAQ
jgi:hypothetical protein